MAWQIPVTNTSTTINLTTVDSLYVARPILVGMVSGGGSNHQVIVDGTVATGGDAIFLSGGSFTHSASSVTVNESGIVRGFQYSGIAIYGFASTVTNHGYVFGGHSGVMLNGESSTTSSKLTNDGVIESDRFGVSRFSGTETIVIENLGTISGKEFSFGQFSGNENGRDLITNKGSMIGKINLGAGDDLYDGRLGTVVGNVEGGTDADRLYAGAGNSKLYGQDGDDVLMGGAGADTLVGGAGSDRATYFSATTAVSVSLSSASFNKGDAAGDVFRSIENLSGSSFGDHLYGNSSANAISGGAGNDVIRGYAGDDTLTGGAGKDNFVFHTALNVATNVDQITDFKVVDDTMQLDNAIFTALTATGVLSAGAFRANGTGLAADSSDRILYESDTGELYYDRDGSANSFDSVHFATVSSNLALKNTDFIII